jgi:hypothetical protein
MALDNLIEADAVLADGRILTCSKKENEDLFWAIRGAGSAFGIVTRFVFQAHEIDTKVWTGTMMFEPSHLKGVVDMVNEVTSEGNDGTASMTFAISARSGELEVHVLVFYNGSEAEAKTYFAPLLELPRKVDLVQMVPFSQATMPHGFAPGRQWRTVIAGSCLIVPLDHSFIQSLMADLEELVTKIPDALETIIACEMHNPYATMRGKQTSTAFPFSGRHGCIQLMPTWTQEENDKACWAWCRKEDTKFAKGVQTKKERGGDG